MAESNQSSPNLSQQNQTPRTVTETVQEEEEATPSPPVLQLRLQQAKNGHKVKWATDTVDNEFMGKKKSKCCCIYEKPKVFGESDTSSDEEDDGCTPHCKGHKKKCYRHHKPHGPDAGKDEHNDQDSLHKDGPSTIPEPSRADDASPT